MEWRQFQSRQCDIGIRCNNFFLEFYQTCIPSTLNILQKHNRIISNVENEQYVSCIQCVCCISIRYFETENPHICTHTLLHTHKIKYSIFDYIWIVYSNVWLFDRIGFIFETFFFFLVKRFQFTIAVNLAYERTHVRTFHSMNSIRLCDFLCEISKYNSKNQDIFNELKWQWQKKYQRKVT